MYLNSSPGAFVSLAQSVCQANTCLLENNSFSERKTAIEHMFIFTAIANKEVCLWHIDVKAKTSHFRQV